SLIGLEQVRCVVPRAFDSDTVTLRLFRQVPPGNVATDKLGSAAAVDNAVSHDCAIVNADADERAAAGSAVIDCAAGARLNVVIARVSRSKQDDAPLDQQRHALA